MTDTLLDSTIRRDAQLQRFGTYLKSEYITPAMQELSREIPKLLAGFDELNKAEKNKLARDIRAIIQERMGVMFGDITSELQDMNSDEAEFVRELYSDYTTATLAPVVASTAISFANNAVMSLEKGKGFTTGLWSELVEQNIITAIREVDGVVRRGFRDGDTLQSITQELRGSYNRSTKRYMGGILNSTNANRAEALARTGVSHYANRARDSFAAKNKDVLSFYQFFATLDNRTTNTCLSLHLNKYDIDDPNKPVLPIHFGERSIYLFGGPTIDPTEGSRPVIGGQRGAKAREEFEQRQSRTDRQVKYKGRKDSSVFDVEQVSAKVTSQEWLSRQPRWFVESTLGKTRTRLFLDGDLDIKKLTDLQGRPLTLAELRETAAGEKAYRRLGG